MVSLEFFFDIILQLPWQKLHSTSTMDLKLKKKLVKCYIWSIALYGVETWTFRTVDQKYLESFEM
jgi:hypothetical protein